MYIYPYFDYMCQFFQKPLQLAPGAVREKNSVRKLETHKVKTGTLFYELNNGCSGGVIAVIEA